MRTLLLAAFLIPSTAFALSYEKQSLLYTDAPFLPAESAGISLLTTLGALEGNPDGSFQAARSLNRAEFLKIALASAPNIRVSKSDATNCFPDVRQTDWFSPYVCLAKKRGMVSGYDDGKFRPENSVNYAEALKMLGELYNYTAYTDPNAPWYDIYVQSAKNHKVILPIALPYDRFITRGQMARLAAAYRTEHEGELNLYRLVERGESVFKMEPKADDVVEVVDVDEVVEEEVKEEITYELPVTSLLLLTGEDTPPLADMKLFTREKPVRIRLVTITLEQEARTLESLVLADEDGEVLATLELDIRDNDNETWFANLGYNESGTVLPARTGTQLMVLGKIKEVGKGGYSLERIKIKSILITVGDNDNPASSYQLVPSSANYPLHQTTRGSITRVESVLTGEGELTDGTTLLAKYAFEGRMGAGEVLHMRSVQFHVHVSGDVRVNNWTLRATGVDGKHDCSKDEGEDPTIYTVNCLRIPEEIGSIRQDGIRSLEFSGEVDLDYARRGARIQVQIEETGSLAEGAGSIRWTDGQGEFNWVDIGELDEGKAWLKSSN